MTEPATPPPAPPVAPPDTRPEQPAPRAAGCWVVGTIFVVVAFAVWLVAVIAYGFIVEEWRWIKVRREFGYDWGLLYAPLLALGVATAAAYFVSQRISTMRMIILTLAAGLLVFFGLLLLFGLGLFF